MTASAITPRAEIDVPPGSKVVVASDLFLSGEASPAAESATLALAGAIAQIEGPGALVIAGNLFELPVAAGTATRGSSGYTPAQAINASMAAHPRLSSALAKFLQGRSRRVVLLPGTRDRAICYDAGAIAAVAEHGFEVALSADLSVATDHGRRQVIVEPGWRYDPVNAYADPTDPRDTPLGHHAVTDLFPALRARKPGWLEGIDRLADQAGMPRFVTSRLMYRRIGRYAWWLVLPTLVAILAGIPFYWTGVSHRLRGADHVLRDVIATLAVELVVMAVLLAIVNRRLWLGAGSALLGPPGSRANDEARDAARRLVSEGFAGVITGHTLRAELGRVGAGFFANTGACAELVEERRSVLGMPPVFVSDEQISFVEVSPGGDDVTAELHLARRQRRAGSVLERIFAGRPKAPTELSVVAAYPGDTSWPPVEDPTRHRRRIRRAAGAIVLLAGALSLGSALFPVTLRGRLHPYLGYVPLGVSEAAGALTALAGVALLVLALGLRRGQRLAWLVSLAILSATAALHLVRGGRVPAAVLTIAVIVFLLWARDCFRGRFDPPSIRAGTVTLIGGAVGITIFTTLSLWLGVAIYRGGHHHTQISSLSLAQAFQAAAGGLVGLSSSALPDSVADFLEPALIAVGIGLAIVALWLVFRPVVDRQLHRSRSEGGLAAAAGAGGQLSLGRPTSDFERARDIVARRGAGTLDYFALRDDKQYYFDRDSVVAFAIRSGVCLVSPDPIGPAEERQRVWAGFRRFADEHGWAVAILAAGEDWLPIYRNSGMRDLYIGDEGVVDVRELCLQGGSKKGLRQAVNRIAKYGYTIAFHDPTTISPALACQLRDIMVRSRRGGVERGFSMTLGRVFDPSDEGLLLAVASDASGAPVAFCQFVPSAGIGGYSLDLMRRDTSEHPNGLFDFILVRTMEHLKQAGQSRLGLNFAMMRAVLAGEAGDGISTKVERWLLKRMSESMQIESLWRFNAKFDPEWLPRFVVWDSAEQSLAAALAIAKAESFWELPIIGRFLVPAAGDTQADHDGPVRREEPARSG
ncbi:MAG: phosphatidylglycerol lysyltransferase domain-containing protein [Acidimicrobiales bacterium]